MTVCSFLNCKVRIPLLETRVVLIQSTVLTIEGENFRINDSDKTFFKSYLGKVLIKRYRTHRKKKYENSTSSHCQKDGEFHSFLSKDVYPSNDLSEFGQVSTVEIGIKEPNKAHDFQNEENLDSPNKHNAVSVNIPSCMKIGELKGGVLIIRVEDEIFPVSKETKEQIEKNNLTYPAPEMNCASSTVSRKGFNSSSTFIEKEEKVLDRAYFHVFRSETHGENEIYLDGVFVENV